MELVNTNIHNRVHYLRLWFYVRYCSIVLHVYTGLYLHFVRGYVFFNISSNHYKKFFPIYIHTYIIHNTKIYLLQLGCYPVAVGTVTYIHKYIQTCIHAYIHTYIMHTYAHSCIHAYIHIHTYTYAYIHTYIRTSCIHTYVHT